MFGHDFAVCGCAGAGCTGQGLIKIDVELGQNFASFLISFLPRLAYGCSSSGLSQSGQPLGHALRK